MCLVTNPLWFDSWRNSHIYQIVSRMPALSDDTSHDDFNTDKVCNSANPTQVGFVHIYEPCILVTVNEFFLSDDVIPMTSSVNVGKRKSDGIFGIFGVTMLR